MAAQFKASPAVAAPCDTDRIPASNHQHAPPISEPLQERNDPLMSKQASFFGSATLTRPWDLAGPSGLTKREQRSHEEQEALGGMRRPDLSVRRSPKYRAVGKKLRTMLEAMVDSHDEALSVIEAVRSGSQTGGFSQDVLRSVREEWLHALHAPPSAPVVGLDAFGRLGQSNR